MPPINPHDFTSIPLRGKRRKVAAQARSHDIWETPSRLGAEEPGTQIPPFFVAFFWLVMGILFQVELKSGLVLVNCRNMNHIESCSIILNHTLSIPKSKVYNLSPVGGFNPSQKYQSNRIISPGRGEHQKCLKPPPIVLYNLQNTTCVIRTF